MRFFAFGDRATVLRDGQNAGTFDIRSVDLKTLVKSMLGRTLKEEFPVREGLHQKRCSLTLSRSRVQNQS